MAIRHVAALFAAEKASVVEMWQALHEHLHDLCADYPLSGDFLALFAALEAWEASAKDGRERAVVHCRRVAHRLSTSA
jgi:hypothetical protein